MIKELVRSAVAVSDVMPVYVPITEDIIRTGARRSYSAALGGRLRSDWSLGDSRNPNASVNQIPVLRRMARGLHNNSGIVVRAFKLKVRNVVGPRGFAFRCTGSDAEFNSAVETEFWKWAKVASVNRRDNLRRVCNFVIIGAARDGSALIRFVRGFDNPYGFALQVIEPDQIAESLNDEHRNIISGREFDEWGALRAVHLKEKKSVYNEKVIRVPAEDIIEYYLPERIGQATGAPELRTVIKDIEHLEKYREGTLVQNRAAAAVGGFIEKVDPDASYSGGDDDDSDLEYGDVMEIAPGMFQVLPAGYKMNAFQPNINPESFTSFSKAVKRDIAAAVGVSYSALAQDYEGANYSSLRQEALVERDMAYVEHDDLISLVLEPVAKAWFWQAFLFGRLPRFDLRKVESLFIPEFIGRGFDWVDPVKDVNGIRLALEANLTTLAAEVGKKGEDWEDVIKQRQKEIELIEKTIKGGGDASQDEG